MNRAAAIRACFAVGCAMLMWTPSARAGEPLMTDDTGVPEAGKFEFKLAYQVERTPGAWTHELPVGNLEYSFVKDMSASAEVPFLLIDPEGEGTRSGVGNTTLEYKWNFLHQEEAGFELSIAPKVEFNNPTHSVRRGIVQEGTDVILPVQIGRTWGEFEVFAEAGYEFIQHDHNHVYGGVAAGYHLTDKLELLAELHTDTDSYFDTSAPIAQLGFTYEFAEDCELLFAAGRSLRSERDDATFLAYLGVQWTF